MHLPDDLYSLSSETLDGQQAELGDFRGRVTLVVNLASRCGYTPQYAGLQALHAELEPRGFSVLGFPCNDFGAQEPGEAHEIRTFCDTNYGVSFPLFRKVVSQPDAEQSPVYGYLGRATGELPKWNFGKYLVSKEGRAIRYFAPDVAPESAELRAAIDAALAE